MSERNLPLSWVSTHLANIATIITGNTPPTADVSLYGGSIPFVGPSNLLSGPIHGSDKTLNDSARSVARIVPNNSVLVSCIGLLGKTGYTIRDTAFNQQLNAVIFNDVVDMLFGFYQCQTLRKYLKGVASATTVPIVNKGKFSLAPFRLPPLQEQRRIVAKIEELFSDLDAGVVALERAKANLKRYRAAVLKAAVEGQLTAAWRAEHTATEPASKLLERILKERRQKWEADQLAKFAAANKEPPKNWKAKYAEPAPPDKTGLPELPTGWCWASVEQICDVGTGTTPSRANSKFYENGTVPWIMSTAVNLPFVDEATEYVTELAIEETTLRLYPVGTLILALYGEGKTRGMVSELRIEAAINQALGALVFAETAIKLKNFVKVFLTSNYVQLRRQAAGGMQPNLNLGIVKQIAIPLAPFAEQAQIVDEVAATISQIDAAESAIEQDLSKASRLKQSILKQAFEGKLVPQDPNDEPASKLVERIAGQKNGTVADIKTKTKVKRIAKSKQPNA